MTRTAGARGSEPPIRVAVGVIEDPAGRVLIAERAAGQSHAGLWEFPGGKLDGTESSRDALERELWEELGIRELIARPFMSIPWTYADKRVHLEVFKVSAWQGVPHGREGQAVQWVVRDELQEWPLPAANRGIVQALRLPNRYLITPEPGDPESFLHQLEIALRDDIKLLQFRAKGLTRTAWLALGQRTLALAAAANVRVLVNANPADAAALGASGLHLTSERLMRLQARPEGFDWCAASCHNLEELQHAAALQLDFIVLGPVLATLSHPAIPGLGWQRVAPMVAASPVPVYLLGGLASHDLDTAMGLGAQGVAAIRAWWPGMSRETQAPAHPSSLRSTQP